MSLIRYNKKQKTEINEREKNSNGRVSANVQALTELLLSATHAQTTAKMKRKYQCRSLDRQTDRQTILYSCTHTPSGWRNGGGSSSSSSDGNSESAME